MSRRDSPAQPDLFAVAEPEGEAAAEMARMLRVELQRMLDAAEAPGRAAWADITAATVAELRFNAMAARLPAEEAAALRARHDAALERYYGSLPPAL